MKQHYLSLIAVLLFVQHSNAQWFNWEARLGSAPGELSTLATEMTAKGFTPSSVSGHFGTSRRSVSTLWLKYPMFTPWEIRTGLTLQQLVETTNRNKDQNLIPANTNVYIENGEVKYDMIYSFDNTTAWQSRTEIPEGEFLERSAVYTDDGYRLVDLDGYVKNGQRYYSGIWKRFSNLPWRYVFGQDEYHFKQSVETAANDGLVPTVFQVFIENGQQVYNAVFVKIQDETFQIKYNVLKEDLETTLDTYTDQGYALSQISSYALHDSEYYSLVFSKVIVANPYQQPTVSVATPINMSSGVAATRSKQLAIPAVEQQTNVWCWLAVGEMIFRHLGAANPNTAGNYQCGIIGSLSFVDQNCSNNCFNSACIIPSGSNYNTVRMLRDYSWTQQQKVFQCSEGRELTMEQIMANIDGNKPIMAGLSYYRRVYHSGAEHVSLITGYDRNSSGDFVIVNDPFPYPGNSNPFLMEGGVQLSRNQYKISLKAFTERIFWHWSIYDIQLVQPG